MAGRKILVIEDAFLIAMQISQMIHDLGGEVVGPGSTVALAVNLMTHSNVDGAVVDVRLGSETSTTLVKDLRTRGVPLVLTTGYAEESLPEDLAQIPRLSKPYSKSAFEGIVKQHLVTKDDASPE